MTATDRSPPRPVARRRAAPTPHGSPQLVARHAGVRRPQHRAHPPDPREAARRHHAAADVRAAVRVRVRRRHRRAGGNYREYLIGGILVQSLAFGMMGPATAIATDLTEGVIDRFRSLPARRSAYLLGHFLAELGRDGAVDRHPARRRPARRLAHPHRRVRTSSLALVLLAAVRLGDDLDRHVDRADGALARRGHGRRLHRRVPADVPEQRVRADRHRCPTCCSASPRGTRSACSSRPCRELFGNTPASVAGPEAGRSSTPLRWRSSCGVLLIVSPCR